MPRCSFIVSTFERPRTLRCVLASLQVQTEPDFEVIVTDNSRCLDMRRLNQAVIHALHDERFQYLWTGAAQCYEAANMAWPHAQGEYLCHPSDDGYYVPMFLELLLNRHEDLVYCDMVYDPRSTDRMHPVTQYRVVNVIPKLGTIDKGGFIVRRSRWGGFPWKENVTGADGLAVEKLIRARISHFKVPGVLWVHN